MIDHDASRKLLDEVQALGLLTAAEVAEVNNTLLSCHPFADGVKFADTLHVNIKVDDIDCIPRDFLEARAARPENAKDGYIKYAFPGGLNVILSSINISQDDLAEARQGAKKPRPYLDHLGIDLRQEVAAVRNLFDAIPYLATRQGWAYASQGAPGKPVFCCHVQVNAKHWVYPRNSKTGLSIPLEFAYGPLVVNEHSSGCDLRPADPLNIPEGATTTCGAITTACSAA